MSSTSSSNDGYVSPLDSDSEFDSMEHKIRVRNRQRDAEKERQLQLEKRRGNSRGSGRRGYTISQIRDQFYRYTQQVIDDAIKR